MTETTADLPASVRLVPGDLDRLVVESPAATAEIYLQGAHVAAWAPSTHAPVLFVSGASDFAPGAAIRGGIPLCFPWFGAGQDQDRSPMHGFARVRPWDVVDVDEHDDAVTVALRLTDDESTRELWPHTFEATLRVTVGQTLTLALEVRNTGTDPARFDEALHTYFTVSDVESVRVSGLEGVEFFDRITDGTASEDQPVRLTGLTDRVYLGSEGDVAIDDLGQGRRIVTRTQRSRSRVVWNPWAEKAAAMADLEATEWRRFLCVEVGNVWSDGVELAPGETHTMTAEIAVETLEGDVEA